jgi:hypothetical protein
MSNTFLHPVQSNPTTQFIEALAAAGSTFTPPFVGSALYNLPGLPPVNSRRYLIRAIEYLCVQDVGLEFDFWNSASGLTNAIATDAFISRFQFGAVNGAQFNGAGLFRFYVDGLAIPYFDADSVLSTTVVPTLHVAVQNVDTVAKSAGAPGAVNATFWLEPMQAW